MASEATSTPSTSPAAPKRWVRPRVGLIGFWFSLVPWFALVLLFVLRPGCGSPFNGLVGPLLIVAMLAVPAALVLCLVGLFTDRPRRWALVGLALSLLLLTAAAIVFARMPSAGSVIAERTEAMRQDYLLNEGHARRGMRFAQLVLWLDQLRRLDQKLTEAELLEYLGAPDLVAGDESVKRFVYYFDGSATRDSVVYVTIEHGKADFGFGAAGANDHRKYEPPSPPPDSAGGGRQGCPAGRVLRASFHVFAGKQSGTGDSRAAFRACLTPAPLSPTLSLLQWLPLEGRDSETG